MMFACSYWLIPLVVPSAGSSFVIVFAGMVIPFAILGVGIHCEPWAHVTRLFILCLFPLAFHVYAFTCAAVTRNFMVAGSSVVLLYLETSYPGWREWFVDSKGTLYAAKELRVELHLRRNRVFADILRYGIRMHEERIADNYEQIRRARETIRQNNLLIEAIREGAVDRQGRIPVGGGEAVVYRGPGLRFVYVDDLLRDENAGYGRLRHFDAAGNLVCSAAAA